MDILMTEVLGVVIIIFMVVIVVSAFGAQLLPWGCNYNNLCENRFTFHLYDRDRLEGVVFPCFMTDCCYDTTGEAEARADCEDRAAAYVAATGEPIDPADVCLDLNPRNPFVLFSCTYSDDLCNNETCKMNCNMDYHCDSQLGESPMCQDCWSGAGGP
jgi:hypothetical protein